MNGGCLFKSRRNEASPLPKSLILFIIKKQILQSVAMDSNKDFWMQGTKCFASQIATQSKGIDT